METLEDVRKRWTQLVAKTWKDESLRQRLLSNPEDVLKEHGIKSPAGAQVRVLENNDKVIHFTLPARPAVYSDELSDADLEAVAGGACYDMLWSENPQ